MLTKSEILKRLQEAILKSSLSKAEIAKKSNVSQSVIKGIVNYNRCPTLKTFAKLCYGLDISANDILGMKK